MAQPERTGSQCGCPRRLSQKAKISSIELGCLKIRGLVAIRASALNANGEDPNRASPRRILSSQHLQTAWRAESPRNA
jgi:hypothetical protein